MQSKFEGTLLLLVMDMYLSWQLKQYDYTVSTIKNQRNKNLPFLEIEFLVSLYPEETS